MLQFGPTFEHLSTLVDKARTVKKPRCLNPTCSLHGNVESTGIIRYGFYRTTAGKRGVGARMRAGLRASNRRARHRLMRYETGLPSSVIRFRT